MCFHLVSFVARRKRKRKDSRQSTLVWPRIKTNVAGLRSKHVCILFCRRISGGPLWFVSREKGYLTRVLRSLRSVASSNSIACKTPSKYVTCTLLDASTSVRKFGNQNKVVLRVEWECARLFNVIQWFIDTCVLWPCWSFTRSEWCFAVRYAWHLREDLAFFFLCFLFTILCSVSEELPSLVRLRITFATLVTLTSCASNWFADHNEWPNCIQ